MSLLLVRCGVVKKELANQLLRKLLQYCNNYVPCPFLLSERVPIPYRSSISLFFWTSLCAREKRPVCLVDVRTFGGRTTVLYYGDDDDDGPRNNTV